MLYFGRLKRKYNIYSQHVSAHQVAFGILLSFKGHQVSNFRFKTDGKLSHFNNELVEDNPTWPRKGGAALSLNDVRRSDKTTIHDTLKKNEGLSRLNLGASRERTSGRSLKESSLYNQGRNFLITPEILVGNEN